jgi:hypothetical protein
VIQHIITAKLCALDTFEGRGVEQLTHCLLTLLHVRSYDLHHSRVQEICYTTFRWKTKNLIKYEEKKHVEAMFCGQRDGATTTSSKPSINRDPVSSDSLTWSDVKKQ